MADRKFKKYSGAGSPLQGFYARSAGNEEDEYGLSLKTFQKWELFFRFFYEEYFQVEVLGLENIPDQGRVVLAGNHSGGLPIDAFMLQMGVCLNHPRARSVRFLAHDWVRNNPVFGEPVRGMGGVPASFEVAQKLLENEGLVFFYPEGTRGTGKLFASRYRLIDFDPGFVKAAILTGSPIIPVTTVGGDELFPILRNMQSLARFLRMPYYPVTFTFPWLPLFSSCIPLPIKMLIKIHKPIHLSYPPEKAQDHQLRLRLAKEIQYEVQKEMNFLLLQRQSPFAGWDIESLHKMYRSRVEFR